MNLLARSMPIMEAKVNSEFSRAVAFEAMIFNCGEKLRGLMVVGGGFMEHAVPFMAFSVGPVRIRKL